MNYIKILISCFLIISCKNKKDFVLNENFNKNTIDATIWNYDIGNGCPNLCGWGINERQIYTQKNVNIIDGKLRI